MNVYKLYSIERKAHLLGIPVVPKFIKLFIRVACSATIPFTCQIGEGTIFPHGAQGVVIHDDAVIGKECKILPNVVIGGKSDIPIVPKVGDGVLIGAGAAILGPVKIGDRASIGANAVVVHDIPEGAVAVGVPAKILE